MSDQPVRVSRAKELAARVDELWTELAALRSLLRSIASQTEPAFVDRYKLGGGRLEDLLWGLHAMSSRTAP